MGTLDAYSVVATVVKGTDAVLSMDIVDSNGAKYNLTGCDVLLRIGEMYGTDALVEIQGEITSIPDGYVDFTFTPETLTDLHAITYDMVVYVISLTEVYVALRGRLGILAGMNEEVVEIES